MNAKILLIALLAIAATTVVAYELEDAEYEFLFTKFVKQHNKKYDGMEEMLKRFRIFKDNMDHIVRHQRKPNMKYTLAMNEYGDMSNAEFKARFNNYQPITLRDSSVKLFNATGVKVPASVNWVNKGVVTGVKNQGQCGSCWAFSTTGSTESAHAIATGQLISLSEQELVDCSGSVGNQGCNGGEMQAAMQWIISNGGLCTESAYPYQGVDGTCQSSSCTSAVTISSYVNVAVNDETALTAAIAQQPISVAVDAGGSDWQLYSGGVLTDSGCGTQLDHGVLAVGYGTDSSSGTPYYLVKNSWGTSWGLNGYIMLERGVGGAGMCGIAEDPSYPVA